MGHQSVIKTLKIIKSYFQWKYSHCKYHKSSIFTNQNSQAICKYNKLESLKVAKSDGVSYGVKDGVSDGDDDDCGEDGNDGRGSDDDVGCAGDAGGEDGSDDCVDGDEDGGWCEGWKIDFMWFEEF